MNRKGFFYLFLLFNVTITVINVDAADIYVSLKGNDFNLGTKEKPLSTLHSALRKARELRRLNDPSIKGGIKIILENGVYKLNEPLIVHPEDSGTKDSPTEIIAASKGKVVLSGGVELVGWKKVVGNISGLPKNAIGNVWSANVPSPAGQTLVFRQLWLNAKKATKARDKNGEEMSRILSWDFKNQTCRIPLLKNIHPSTMAGMEMVIHQWWAIANLRIKSAKTIGNAIELTFMQPESRIQSEHPWPAPWISESGNSAFYLTNSIQFLDEPGEWYEDLYNHKVYYWPKKNEQMQNADAVVPHLETLLKIEGTIDNPVVYVTFKGISFEHSTWLRPSKEGHVPHQTGMYMLDAYKLEIPGTPDKQSLENQAWVGRPAAAVEVSYATNTNFENCRFEHLASTGLDYKKGTRDNVVKGNLFKDIGGSGILVGTFSDEAVEVHLPYKPSDLREVATGNRIENNLITDVTNEDWGAVGIGAGYVSDLKILNNEINEVSYTGISVGWGWTKSQNVMKNNLISENKIHHYGKRMYDVAGIYTLSAQPGTQIIGNDIDYIYDAPYAHLPDHWFYIYTDEGSSGITLRNNWTPAEKYLQNANGPDNLWENNGPKVAESIRQNAGLQKEFHYLLKDNSSPSLTQKIKKAEDKQALFELVFKSDELPNTKELTTFAKENNLLPSSFFKWNNRLIIYTSSLKVESLTQTLKKFKANEIKLYDDMFYDFNRKKICGVEPAKEWDHVILSANLVDDQKLQKEYLNYHKTQFEKWPELSKGFCNADFQQLVIFRNGRQLMLIISIPKGADLDKLNPKTTENNPRVNEWNALMKKYQEGIEGTKKDEVWVFFKKIN
ncbi:L-rhamnose mutarotase [Pedobacter polaris]|uniref:L-rhamnose mutarotase n=1 Tax=Pedobacter polaris TaxID=2571273 RepID=A0A4U1CRM9_9SPHI|nr:right-handed parallel beta-helix repeat-containing protein [Pedobacter polaris]TKC10126.1 L-rhamnose mutarotase [Pedobacter polaris]